MGNTISIFISLLFYGILLVCIYHVVKSAVKDAVKENRNEIKLLLKEEIHKALKEFSYSNNSTDDQ